MAALFCLGLPSYLRGLTRRRGDCIREEWDGAADLESARDLAVVVHFDQDGYVSDWLHRYLHDLGRAGFAVIFVSNAPRLDSDTVARLRSRCGLVMRRDNVGHDFGAYKDGIDRIPDLRNLRRLILANDSVYGPLYPVADFVADMSPDLAAVWSITDSFEGHHHLQSYFLLFHSEALDNEAFARFWLRHRYVQSRYWNILMHEMGLSRVVAGAGLRCRALCPYLDAISILSGRDAGDPGRKATNSLGSVQPVNPTHDLWRILIADMGCPFIKRDLLRTNPNGDLELDAWRDLAAGPGAWDSHLSERQARDDARIGDIPSA